MSDVFDNEREPPSRPEGVRILGAEEARAAVGGDEHDEHDDGTPAHDEASETERDEDLDEGSEAEREARFLDEGPTWSARAQGFAAGTSESGADEDDEEEPLEAQIAPAAPLPHWTEPPTGSVPAVDPESADDDFDAWASITGSQPRFRAEDADWAEADYATGDLTDEHTRVGAMAAIPVDEEEEFAEEVARRRRRGGTRVAAETPPSRRVAPPTPPPTEEEVVEGGRDLPVALATAAVVAVVSLIALKLGRVTTAWLAAVIVGVSMLELTSSMRSKGHKPAVPLALLGGVGLVLGAEAHGVSAFPVITVLVGVFSLLWFLWEVTPGRPLPGVATTVFAYGYVGVLGGFAGLMLQSRDGTGLVLGTAICAIAYDVLGYFVGSRFGRSQVAPRISPHKTLEGTLAGMTASIVLGWLVVGRIHPWDGGSALVLGILVAIGAFLGDLVESMVKRDLGIKDFGSLLPGHGGVLDRFDAILFCLPITYYLALHLHLVHLA